MVDLHSKAPPVLQVLTMSHETLTTVPSYLSWQRLSKTDVGIGHEDIQAPCVFSNSSTKADTDAKLTMLGTTTSVLP
jgi:hypothetical protein